MLARERMGIPEARLAACARSSIDSSFAPADLKRDALARVDAWQTGAADPAS